MRFVGYRLRSVQMLWGWIPIRRAYDIGSGSVEGACKHVVAKRLKQSGMIWTQSGSSVALALHIAWLNGQWDTFWENRPMAA
jgi:hypothetical protein